MLARCLRPAVRRSAVRVRSPSACMAARAPLKRAMTKIGTHSGTFHCDEALGCYLLKQTRDFANGDVVRTRAPEAPTDLTTTSVAFKKFSAMVRATLIGFGTKLSSAGLVYKHYGREVVAKLMGKSEADADVECVYLAVYKNFMEAIDAIDNGINQWEGGAPPKYRNGTDLSSRVGFLNPRWNEPTSDEDLYTRFLRAMELTGREFADAVDYHAQAWLPGRAPVRAAIAERYSVDESGRIILLEAFCPWKDHLYELEAELGVEPPILYCLYEDEREHKWRIQAVAVAPSSFQSRRPLPKAWQGLRDSDLDAAAGISGCVFVHATGFIGGHKTRTGVLQMARKALLLEA